MSDVFLSYVRHDKPAVARLVEALRAEGFDVWWDDDIPIGAAWEGTIEQALADARVVIVCWSPGAIASDNVRSEARWARGKGRLVQVFVEGCEPPLFFGERQGIDLAAWDGTRGDRGFRRLTTSLAGVLGEPNAAVATATTLAPEARPARSRRRGWAFAVALLLLVAVVGAAAWWRIRGAEGGARLVLVEPLTVSAGDAVAGLLRQSLSNDLSRLIVGRNTTLTIADPGEATSDTERRATFVVSGNAQVVGGTLHATVQLTGQRDLGILWSNDFERSSGDVDALRQQMANSVANVLVCVLNGNGGVPADLDVATTKLFLAACEHSHQDWAQTRSLLSQVVARRPVFPQAWGMLSSMLYVEAALDAALPQERKTAAFADAAAAARRALAQNPHMGDAYFALAGIVRGPNSLARRMDIIRRGIAADPDSAALETSYMVELATLGRYGAALAHGRRAAELDPFGSIYAANLADGLAYTGAGREADDVLQRAQQYWPGDWVTGQSRFEIAARVGDPRAALAMLDRHDPVIARLDRVPVWRAFLQARIAPSPAATDNAVRAIGAAASTTPAGERLELISHLVQLGRLDAAFAMAGTLPVVADSSGEVWFRNYMAPLRADPRFMSIMAAQGLVRTWRQTGTWPDMCSDGSVRYDCKVAAGKAETRT